MEDDPITPTHAGPLPALFLRETAEGLRRSPVPLYLFLGSDFPINDANKFTGLQTEHFQVIRRTGEPQFFLDPDIGFQTAMFTDIASAEACVVCHNSDANSAQDRLAGGRRHGCDHLVIPGGRDKHGRGHGTNRSSAPESP